MKIEVSDLFEGSGQLVPQFAVKVALVVIERLSFILQARDLYPFVERVEIRFLGSQGSVTLELTMKFVPYGQLPSDWKRTFDISPEKLKESESLILQDALSATMRSAHNNCPQEILAARR